MPIACFHCGRAIRGEAMHVIPTLLAVRVAGDFPKAYHPACYAKAEEAAGFELRREPATQPKPATFESTRTSQRKLLTGLDCIAGQSSLFDTDGTR